jgi:hypothetical protein
VAWVTSNTKVPRILLFVWYYCCGVEKNEGQRRTSCNFHNTENQIKLFFCSLKLWF